MTRFADLFGRNREFEFAYGDNFTALLNYLEQEGSENINRSSEKNCGHTSVHFACYGGGHPSSLYLLKEYGADLFQKDYFGRSALFVAANAGKRKIIEYLLNIYKQANISPIEADVHGRSFIHAICSLGSSLNEKAADNELAGSLELLLACYADDVARKQALEQQDVFGLTPVQLAIASGYIQPDTELAKVFIKYGINPFTSVMPENGIPRKNHDFFFRTELMYNAFAGSLDIVQRELTNGADPNEGNPQFGDRNSLHLACNGIAGPEFLQAIMKHPSIDMKKCDGGGTNAFMFAANTGRLDTVETLVNGVTLLDGQIIKFPIECINDQDGMGFTALHAVAMASSRPNGRVNVIELLIEKLNIDATIKSKNGQTALELAVSRGNSVAANAIIEALAKRQTAEAVNLTQKSTNEVAENSKPVMFSKGYVDSSTSNSAVDEQVKDTDHAVTSTKEQKLKKF